MSTTTPRPSSGAQAKRVVGKRQGGRRTTTTTKSGARQLDQIPASSYVDAEQALEAGIQLEEKAERFAVGDKAKKYFTLSVEAYERALHLDERNADAAYNVARVLFIVATSFSLPPASVNGLHEAIRRYNVALGLLDTDDEADEDGLPSAFTLDVQFNLAAALVALAEQVDRVGSPFQDVTSAALLREGVHRLESVLDGQEKILRRQKRQEEEDATAEIERPPLSLGATVGKDADADADAVADASEESNGIDAQLLSSSSSSDTLRAEYTSSLVTPASALETIVSLHGASIAMLDSSSSDQAEVVRILHACSLYHAKADAIYVLFPDGDRRSPENEWNEQVGALRYAQLELNISAASLRADGEEGGWTAVGQSALYEAASLLEQSATFHADLTTTNGRAAHKIHVQHLEQLGDLVLCVARTALDHIHKHQGAVDDHLGTQIPLAWQLCTQASKLLLAASKALDPSKSGAIGSSVVLGGVSHQKSALFTNLSAVSVLRSNSVFTQSGAVNGVDEKTCRTLMDNARVYARKSIGEGGVEWLLHDRSTLEHVKAVQVPSESGFERFLVRVEAILALFRILSIRACVADSSIAEIARKETDILCANLKLSVLDDNVCVNARLYRICLGLPSDMQQMPSGRGMLEQAIGQEGEGTVTMDQLQFWARLELVLASQ